MPAQDIASTLAGQVKESHAADSNHLPKTDPSLDRYGGSVLGHVPEPLFACSAR